MNPFTLPRDPRFLILKDFTLADLLNLDHLLERGAKCTNSAFDSACFDKLANIQLEFGLQGACPSGN